VSRYDCELNQWNFCEEFNFVDHPTSAESDSEEEELMAVYEKEPAVSDRLPPKPAHRMSRQPGDDGIPLAYIPDHPTFHNHSIIDSIGDWDFSTPNFLTMTWRSAEGFLAKRYGLMDMSDVRSGEKRLWNKKVGLEPAEPYQDIVELYTSVVANCSWPMTCDLSPELITTPGVFPSRNPANVLALTKTGLGYIVAIQDGVARPWKLLISDPLTILQVERETWCSDGRNLVVNLVLSGLPFEVLHSHCIQEGESHRHPGPELHPDGKDPRLADYYAYRHDLADFLSGYPHAKAAALCAGGILWRLALDVHHFTSEDDVVGPFHASSCVSRMIGGETYWTPRLSVQEENVLVGVYRWAVGKLNGSMAFTALR
jgi:hypothetical protein